MCLCCRFLHGRTTHNPASYFVHMACLSMLILSCFAAISLSGRPRRPLFLLFSAGAPRGHANVSSVCAPAYVYVCKSERIRLCVRAHAYMRRRVRTCMLAPNPPTPRARAAVDACACVRACEGMSLSLSVCVCLRLSVSVCVCPCLFLSSVSVSVFSVSACDCCYCCVPESVRLYVRASVRLCVYASFCVCVSMSPCVPACARLYSTQHSGQSYIQVQSSRGAILFPSGTNCNITVANISILQFVGMYNEQAEPSSCLIS